LWNSGTGGHSGAYAVFRASNASFYIVAGGRVIKSIYDPTNGAKSVTFSTTTTALGRNPKINATPISLGNGSYSLLPGFYSNFKIGVESAYSLKFQTDGNLVIYKNPYETSYPWASKTCCSSNSLLWMQSDGNLVICNTSNKTLWASNTQWHAGAYALFKGSTGAFYIMLGTGKIIKTIYSPV